MPTSEHFPSDGLFLAFQQALIGRYSLDRELGRGGNGIVYLAHDVRLDRPVAIKLLPPALAGQASTRARFLREARLAAGLSHPHIVPVHSVDEVDDFVFFVMAFIDGETLADRVQQRGPVSSGDAGRWLREVAWALSYAHGRAVIHRDIKPDNILIERDSGRALVADFGIAQMGDDVGELIGTPEFLSPEVALGGVPSPASDLYALGVTAWYLLTGRLPFCGATTAEVVAQHCMRAVPSLTAPEFAIPRRLAQLVEWCLAKEPSERPASADVVATHLGKLLEQRRELPVVLRTFARRTGRMDSGGTLLALVGGLGGSLVVTAVAGATAGVATLVSTMLLAPIAFGVSAARHLLREGFQQADVARAFDAELDAVREESTVESQGFRRLMQRALRSVVRIGATTTAALGVVSMSGLVATLSVSPAVLPVVSLMPLLAVVAGATAASLVLWGVAILGRRELDVRFWHAVWTGRCGMMAFRLARRFGRAVPHRIAATHRATELSIGLAAESLFEGLPRQTRRMLRDVPATLEALRHRARLLRERIDQIGDLRDEAGGALRAATVSTVDALRAERAALQEQFSATVASLETLRLGLLRLHAGATTSVGLQTDLRAASALAEELSRLVEAHHEVDALLAPDEATHHGRHRLGGGLHDTGRDIRGDIANEIRNDIGHGIALSPA
ncbi:serine/threonine-protein kinase [Gemmatimonas aurantiaca]|uniref:serine/threonine-protein kinase n=1 Tax=Gemmatimonas aurantiaca TaxID=173480 RepID=UPI00301D59A0